MKTEWEYLRITSDLSDDELRRYGADGWELVGFSVEPDAGLKTAFAVWIFKRQKPKAHK